MSGWASQVFSLELRKVTSYRLDFWSGFILATLVQVAVAYFLWKAVFDLQGASEMEGYTLPALVLYYVLAQLTGKILVGADMGFMSTEIYDGSLNRYLVYPVGFFRYKLITHFAHGLVALGQMGVAIAAYLAVFGIPASIRSSPASVVMGLAIVILAGVTYFLITACLEMVAFWADNVWSLNVMLRFGYQFLGGAMIPLAFFPEWSVTVLKFTPFPYLLSFPVLTSLGRVSVEEWLAGLAILAFWIVFFSGVLALIWRRGTLRYTGVGI